MHKLITILFFLLFISCKERNHTIINDSYSLHSSLINDDFTIEFRKPANFDTGKFYTVVYIADASIGLGIYALGKDSSWIAKLPSNCIIVGIGHVGDWHQKRSRDFIPSDISDNKEKNFGNAANFYNFLKSEIIPFVDKKLPHQKSKVFIGHSFSGLFCLYAALKNEKLFNQYFAISPSVWANDNELLKMEEAFSKNNKDLNANIHIYAGGLEIFNKVLSSSKKIYNNIKARKYKGLSISFQKIGNANHFSIRKPAIDKILSDL